MLTRTIESIKLKLYYRIVSKELFSRNQSIPNLHSTTSNINPTSHISSWRYSLAWCRCCSIVLAFFRSFLSSTNVRPSAASVLSTLSTVAFLLTIYVKWWHRLLYRDSMSCEKILPCNKKIAPMTRKWDQLQIYSVKGTFTIIDPTSC